MKRLLIACLFCLFVFPHHILAQNVIMLAGGGSEGDIGDTSAWSYDLYKSLIENGDIDSDGTVRVAILSIDAATTFIPDYFEDIGAAMGVTVVGTNYEVPNTSSANDAALVGPVASADVIFIKGGDQGEYYDAWNGSLLETHIRTVANNGGALGGTSAGAMSMADHCLCGGKDLISSDPMADAHSSFLDDADGGSGIHSDFLSMIPCAYVETHYTERGRMGRLLGVLAKAIDDTGDNSLFAIGVETSTGVVIEGNVATVMGEGAVSFIQETAGTTMHRDVGSPLVYTDLRLDRLTEGWQFDLDTRLPKLDTAPSDVETVTYPGDGPANTGSLTIDGSVENDNDKFAKVATYNPDSYSLTDTNESVFVQHAVGFTNTDETDDHRGDRQETVFRALYDVPDHTGVILFGERSGISTVGSLIIRDGASPNQLAFGGDMAGIVISSKTITHKSLAPEVNFYGVQSAALVNASVHVIADSETRDLYYNSQTQTLEAGDDEPPVSDAETMHITAISTVVIRGNGGGTVEATVTLTDNLGGTVNDATVSGTFSGDLSGSDTNTTGSDGTTILISDMFTARPFDLGICIDTITHATLSYNPADNTDPGFACDPPVGNSPPTASFSFSITDLTADFTSTSTDSDGSIVSYDWDFGDGATSSEQNPSHTYSTGGTYTATLTVTDDAGDSDTVSQSVTVSDDPPPPTESTMHIASISTSVVRGSGGGTAETTFTIVDNTGAPVEGATVSGLFSGDLSGSDTGVTNISGEVILTSDFFTSRPFDLGICAESVTHPTINYDPAQNDAPSFACSVSAPSTPSGSSNESFRGLPDSFELYQNYPNPFNPTTEIQYALPQPAKVKVVVYNAMGQAVATLVDGYQDAGYHAVTLDASALPSGVYLYAIESGGISEVRKMMLVK